MTTKPVELLIGEGLKAEWFNDDVLGRTLDKIYRAGPEGVFMRITSKAYIEYSGCFLHNDTTSLNLQGEYKHEEGDLDAVPIDITHGFSKDGRPDLKQFVISMVMSDSLPVFIKALSGNTSDKNHFREIVKAYGKSLQEIWGDDKIWVWDSAGYTDHKISATEVETRRKKKGGGRGGPLKDEPTQTLYRIKVAFEEDKAAIEKETLKKEKFIVATNVLDKVKLSDEEALKAYKDQQHAGSGFRFLKDPLFFAHSLFLKNESRIVAMVMIMGLALMIYGIAEKKLREALEKESESIPDQKNKSFHCSVVSMKGCIVPVMDKRCAVLRIVAMQSGRKKMPLVHPIYFFIRNRERITKKWMPQLLWAVLYKEDLTFKAFIIELYDMSNERVAREERKSARATA